MQYISFVEGIVVLTKIHIISAVKYITKDILGIKFQYALDFILILRLLTCFGITTSVSIYNYVPSYSTTMMNIPGAIGSQGYIENTKSVGETIKNVSSNVIGNNNTIFYLINSAEIIWILGIITILMVMIISFIKTNRAVKKDHYIDDEYITDIFLKNAE